MIGECHEDWSLQSSLRIQTSAKRCLRNTSLRRRACIHLLHRVLCAVLCSGYCQHSHLSGRPRCRCSPQWRLGGWVFRFCLFSIPTVALQAIDCCYHFFSPLKRSEVQRPSIIAALNTCAGQWDVVHLKHVLKFSASSQGNLLHTDRLSPRSARAGPTVGAARHFSLTEFPPVG